MNLTEVQALSDWIYCCDCNGCKARSHFCGKAILNNIEELLTDLSNSYCLQRIVCCRNYFFCHSCPLRLKCASYPNRPTSTSRLYAEFGGMRNIDKEIEKLYREVMEKKMENKELIFAYSDYQHCNDINRPPYIGGLYCEECRARGTFCSSPWKLDNEQWALGILADLSNESSKKVYCGYRDGYCYKCTNRICMKELGDSQDVSKYKARICDEVCAKALEVIR